ncbi:hypothetical protein [Kistimonas asteriae]|uniref:hypothetical protein n=1 Tax=Kistimonas asteriae TaxID=517724 RepID=UPI001BADAE9B|nr:hypothetical protein [Kistimonas asteriae]
MSTEKSIFRIEKRLKCYLKLQADLEKKSSPSRHEAIPNEEKEIFLEGIQQGLRMALDMIEEDDNA